MAAAGDRDAEGGEDAAPETRKRRRSKHLHQQKAKKERKKDSKRRRSEAHQRALAETAALEEERGEARAATEAGIAAFEAYYHAQGLCASKTSDGAEELSQVVKALLKPLPISFRVCADARRAEETERAMSRVMSLLKDQSLGAHFAADPAVFWKWCGAWQVRLGACLPEWSNVGRRGGMCVLYLHSVVHHDVRALDARQTQLPFNDRALKEAASINTEGQEHESPVGQNKFAHLRSWMTQSCDDGIISRQEVASMMPVALLDIEPHHAILDMCASPVRWGVGMRGKPG
jgi:16S rRNA C967 or C1407 C5-methylase (RsmB/RsmF family)